MASRLVGGCSSVEQIDTFFFCVLLRFITSSDIYTHKGGGIANFFGMCEFAKKLVNIKVASSYIGI